MSETLPVVYLARHGETAWTITGQRTGLIDLPLTERGECNARRLGQRLSGLMFAKVLTSPLQRAMRTCELAGFGLVAQIDRDLVEWNYGEYEGRQTSEILAERTGNYSATAALAENCRSKSLRALIAWWSACARWWGTLCFFPAGIF